MNRATSRRRSHASCVPRGRGLVFAQTVGQHVTMSDKAQELYDAAFAVLPYLKASTDPYNFDKMKMEHDLSDGDRLRRDAEAADRKDAAILRLREVLADFGAGRAL
jgi:hypothetical protein